MYLRHLHIENLRLIRDLELDFVDGDGEPRMWTVLIGRNGAGKTSILQAIALAAVGHLRANQLAGATAVSMPDRRHPDDAMRIEATFGFGRLGDGQHRRRREYPGHPLKPAQLRSSLSMPPNSADLVGGSEYLQHNLFGMLNAEERIDPLQEARSKELSHWFVAGYGVSRHLTVSDVEREVGKPSHDRLVPLFRPSPLIGLGFADFDEGVAKRFVKILRQVLTRTQDLVPDIRDVETGGRGGIKKAADLYDRDRFEQELPSGPLKLPATWLSHGYQASLAWLADLVGHYLLDVGEEGPGILPAKMEGLVLIDEIDLYLHPRWQAGLVRALKETFPRMQFVATTHSPILLNALRSEEVVMLYLDGEGNVRKHEGEHDPRLLTGTELYSQFFGIDRLYPSDLGDSLDRYSHLAVNPFRSDEEDAEVHRLGRELRGEGIELTLDPVPREPEL
ncbi:AAA family ATPase [Paraliomyxa miuraensis]|uniref:AAA family ATPase n=1 Tax=Paraliomyxa miuraensis TaxID=376150 RepID=UPI002257580E|nr:AAA family ATPase [Paraliomyxa miuraensis]MCX4245698.1 AAA family ATPase [Paraliomyxa miuraensis]